jgi:hypothetical protein
MPFNKRFTWNAHMNAVTLALFLLTAAAVHAAPVDNAESEAETLMTAMLPIGQQMLEKQGKFAPYGGAMTTDGKVVTVAEHSGTTPPSSQEIITSLQTRFRAGVLTGKYKATGLFSDVEVLPPGATEKTRAIAAALDHHDNYSVVIYFPYKILAGKVQFGEVFASPGKNKALQ